MFLLFPRLKSWWTKLCSSLAPFFKHPARHKAGFISFPEFKKSLQNTSKYPTVACLQRKCMFKMWCSVQASELQLWMHFMYLHFSTVTVQSPHHAGMHVHPGKSSPGTKPHRSGTWTHHPGSCPAEREERTPHYSRHLQTQEISTSFTSECKTPSYFLSIQYIGKLF